MRATGTVFLLSALCAACTNPPPCARLYVREHVGTAQHHDVTDRVELFGVGFTAKKCVVVRVGHRPGDTQDAVFTVPGTPPADPYGFVDLYYNPPWFYRVGDQSTVDRTIRVRATDVAGRTVYSDALTAQSFACDAPPPDAAQRLKRPGN
ncbi:hypothetical protein [Paraburkholderia lacunae]|uniref:Uncharacterized protein n=1 Tax=Paraburkholderia lacunae TaxID=2211104 RepID=A0A370MYT6_9BURK|nr:hypothetical protein [Paraburkholderia lacunae]RDJ98540.1 hypothetical protein DLM46_32970 [Paraburkholderia lacunae]